MNDELYSSLNEEKTVTLEVTMTFCAWHQAALN